MNGETNRALLTLTLMIGTLAAIMGASTVNTALPDIMSGLSLSPDQLSWVATSYMLANVIGIPTAAWVGERISRRLCFAFGVVWFIAASAICGISTSFEMMIFARAMQGAAAGLIMPTAQAMLFSAYPPEKRGMAMGIYGMGVIMGPALGPTVGGWLVELFNWRAIFFVNLPFGVLTMLLLGSLPKEEPKAALPFDMPGFIAMALCLSCLQIAVTNGSKDGWDATYIVGCMVTSVIAFVAMLWRELTCKNPLLNLKVFTYPLYNGATVISAIVGFGLFGSTFLVPIYLGTVMGFSALQIGLILLPGSLVMGVSMLISGRLSDKVDSRILLTIGLAFLGYGLWAEALADATSPISLYVWAQVWRGLGIAMCFTPLTAISMKGMPPQMIGQATGIFNLTRQLAGSIGIALLNTALIARSTHHGAIIGQAMSAQDPATQAFLRSTKQVLISRGMSPNQADLGAFTVLGQAIRQHVTVLAYADLFYFCMALVVAGIVPVYFLRAGQPAAKPAQ